MGLPIFVNCEIVIVKFGISVRFSPKIRAFSIVIFLTWVSIKDELTQFITDWFARVFHHAGSIRNK